MSINQDNYYNILELEKSANNEEIFNAYRRLALKYHPKRNASKDFAVNNYQFHLIAEAFTVLSNSVLRGCYDIYGKNGLKNGVKDGEENLKGGFKYSGNAFQLFEKFFGTVNPFTVIKDGQTINDEYGSMFGNGFGGLAENKCTKVPSLELTFEIELEEIYKGGVKTLFYEKQVLNDDQRTTRLEERSVNVEILAGCAEGTKLTFPKMGNEAACKPTSDLIVTIKSKPHPKFMRNGQDLIYTYRLTLLEAINSVPLEVVTLDGRRINVTMDEIISPQTVKLIEREGLPSQESKSKFANKVRGISNKGNLFIKFDIRFPRYLSQDTKDELIDLLKEEEN